MHNYLKLRLHCHRCIDIFTLDCANFFIASVDFLKLFGRRININPERAKRLSAAWGPKRKRGSSEFPESPEMRRTVDRKQLYRRPPSPPPRHQRRCSELSLE
jgi:hypothetical protein